MLGQLVVFWNRGTPKSSICRRIFHKQSTIGIRHDCGNLQLRLTSRPQAPNDLHNHKATRPQRATICGGHGVYMFMAIRISLFQHPCSFGQSQRFLLWFKSQFLVQTVWGSGPIPKRLKSRSARPYLQGFGTFDSAIWVVSATASEKLFLRAKNWTAKLCVCAYTYIYRYEKCESKIIWIYQMDIHKVQENKSGIRT